MKSRLKTLNTVRKIRRAYRERQLILDYMPIRLWVELTNVCNLRCRMCPNSRPDNSKRGFMSFKTFKMIIDQSCGHVYDINLSHRGESLLHDEIDGMIAYAKQMNVATRLNTNATVLTEEKSRKLIESGLDFISFSFDGLDRQTYENIRVGADFDHVVDNITTFLRLKKELGSVTPYTMIEILSLPQMEEHLGKLDQFISRFRDFPLDKITVKPPHNWGGNIESDIGGENAAAASVIQRNYCPCTNIWYSMVVLWDGSVPLCVQDWYNNDPLGNIEDCSLISMWNGNTIVNIRELLAQRQHQQIELCSRCDLLWRPAVKGVPKLNLIGFLSDQILGYGRMRKLFNPLERRLENSTLSGRRAL